MFSVAAHSLKAVNAHWLEYFFSCQVRTVFLWQWIITCSGALILHIWCCVRLKDQYHSFRSEFVPAWRVKRGFQQHFVLSDESSGENKGWAKVKVLSSSHFRSVCIPVGMYPKSSRKWAGIKQDWLLPVWRHRETKKVFSCCLPYLAWRVCSGCHDSVTVDVKQHQDVLLYYVSLPCCCCHGVMVITEGGNKGRLSQVSRTKKYKHQLSNSVYA